MHALRPLSDRLARSTLPFSARTVAVFIFASHERAEAKRLSFTSAI